MTNPVPYVHEPPQGEYRIPGKERDSESGNDYFGARYYASSMGRFMSPDWSARAEPVPYAKMDDPQSLNLYAYVMNNPFSRVDADGHMWDSLLSIGCSPNGGAEWCTNPAEATEAAQNGGDVNYPQPPPEAQKQNSQAVSTVYNETGGLKPDPSSDPNSAAHLQTARQNVAHVYKNTKGKGFQSIDHLSGREKAALAHGNPDSVAAYSSSEQAVAAANRDRGDPTGGATHIYLYDLSPNSAQHVPAWVTNGNPTTVEGPFINAAGGGDVEVGAPVLILTIKDH
jgi:RHS repeat-associated protein